MLGQGGAKLLQLSALRDQLVGGAKDVTALRASIASAVADIHAYTSDARNAAAGTLQGGTARAMTLQQASEAARNTTTDFVHEFYDRHEFDKYLKFASADDQEEYRQREAERRKAIEDALAKHTPQGDLGAANLTLEQLKDAGAHGATSSPAYNGWVEKVTKARDDLASKIAEKAPGQARTTPSATDALDTVKPTAAVSPDLIAALRSTGVVVADQNASGHGVNAAGGQPAVRPR